MPEFSHITETLKTVNRTPKAKLLVVDDEPDNLDLLYRTFRRDFHVLKAQDGLEALKILEAEGEVAVIISDQRMPEMKGTEFFSRTVPQFPNTMRIILTGFTDVEDLVDAINAGQVYRYITKPWEPAELKEVVRIAAETYDLTKHRLAELERNKEQTELLAHLLQIFASDQPLETLLQTATQAIAPALGADGCLLQTLSAQFGSSLSGHQSRLPIDIALPADDPLITQVQTSLTPQIWVEAAENQDLAAVEYYQQAQIKQHLLVPLLYRQDILALLSLQWLNICPLRESDLNLIHLASQQIAFALISHKPN